MALIDGYDEPRNQNPNCLPGVQSFLAYLETQVRGTPGGPVTDPEPFIVREAAELIDGPVVAPEPERSKRIRRKVKPGPALDRDSVNLARYARKLRGEP